MYFFIFIKTRTVPDGLLFTLISNLTYILTVILVLTDQVRVKKMRLNVVKSLWWSDYKRKGLKNSFFFDLKINFCPGFNVTFWLDLVTKKGTGRTWENTEEQRGCNFPD